MPRLLSQPFAYLGLPRFLGSSNAFVRPGRASVASLNACRPRVLPAWLNFSLHLLQVPFSAGPSAHCNTGTFCYLN